MGGGGQATDRSRLGLCIGSSEECGLRAHGGPENRDSREA